MCGVRLDMCLDFVSLLLSLAKDNSREKLVFHFRAFDDAFLIEIAANADVRFLYNKFEE